MSAPVQVGMLEAAAAQASRKAADWLSALQAADGHWCAELTADTTLEADYILFQLWLFPPREGKWEPETLGLVDKAAQSILDRQLDDGGFSIYAGGPSEVSASVKAYVALKLAGLAPGDSRMASLRERILALGGIQAANSYVKVNLSLFDLYPREHCPSIPPEILLLPFGFLYQMSAWTRAIVVSLSIVHSANPRRPVPAGFTLDEIWRPGVSPAFNLDEHRLTWHNFFLACDRFLKWWEKKGSKALRRRAIRAAERWMLDRFDGSDGLGAIYPPMMYSVMALDVLGYAPDNPVRVEALRHFNELMVDDGDRFFFQPCFSPVWDTGIAAYALGESGAQTPSTAQAADWLLRREVRRTGDWSIKRPDIEPSGWAFEYNNSFYPDIDDTAMVALALNRVRSTHPEAHRQTLERAVRWLIAMQSKDGGWAAFDADNNWEFLNQVPFADHNAMLDPSCADITGRVLEALAANGIPSDHTAVRRGVAWLIRHQEADGSFYGRWGVAYIYGTCFALRGMAAAGESDREAHMLRAAEWLRSIQNADGGWGESCESYDRGTFVPGPSTPSQTSWALMGLIAAGDAASSSVQTGIEFLVNTQRAHGYWDETCATGTGFPRVFYLNYHLYKDYFPLLALSAFVKARQPQG
jgi:squalene-hopene/tetraprenyl-beta-curcumene cyclase